MILKLLGLALLPILFVQMPNPAKTHSDSPLSWSETRVHTPLSPAAAADLAKKYLGGEEVEMVSQKVVAITDRDTLGFPVHDRPVYLTRFRFRPVSQSAADSVRVDLFVAVDAVTGGFVVAFTPAKNEWVSRIAPRRPADEQARMTDWTLTPPPTEGMISSLADVLGAVLGHYGRMFVDSGQTVVRSRWVVQKFPARREGDTLVSIRPPAPAWIVHTMGAVLIMGSSPLRPDGTSGEEHYYTEVLVLVADSTLAVGPASFMP